MSTQRSVTPQVAPAARPRGRNRDKRIIGFSRMRTIMLRVALSGCGGARKASRDCSLSCRARHHLNCGQQEAHEFRSWKVGTHHAPMGVAWQPRIYICESSCTLLRSSVYGACILQPIPRCPLCVETRRRTHFTDPFGRFQLENLQNSDSLRMALI
jgi:hypothetical protein